MTNCQKIADMSHTGGTQLFKEYKDGENKIQL